MDRQFLSVMTKTPGLVLMTAYPRSIERVESFLSLAREAGRVIRWPEPVASFLRHMDIPDIVRLEDVPLADIQADPRRLVVQMAVKDIPLLLDVPSGPGTMFLHANGEPLGAFDPDWDTLQD